jgi:hypothetical protein
MNYMKVYDEFKLYHTNSMNVFMHLISTSMCIKAIMNICPEIISLYALTLYLKLDIVNAISCTIHLIFLYYLEKYNYLYSFILFMSGYLLQFTSHIVFNEETYIQSYIHKNNNFKKLLTHTYYLLPCIMDTLLNEIILPKNKIIKGKLENNDNEITEWVLKHNLDKTITTHWWYEDLPDNIKNNFIKLENEIKNKIKDNVLSVHEMNEIYVSSNNENYVNSDVVFYRKHLDGPYYIFPFCSVYRVILAINENRSIMTHIPEMKISETLSENDFLGFDFNRNIHYITNNGVVQNEPRITLKLHYVTYPDGLYLLAKILKYLNIKYDKNARNLFLYTLKPKTIIQKILSNYVIYTTIMTRHIQEKFGFQNIFYIIVLYFCLFIIKWN